MLRLRRRRLRPPRARSGSRRAARYARLSPAASASALPASSYASSSFTSAFSTSTFFLERKKKILRVSKLRRATPKVHRPFRCSPLVSDSVLRSRLLALVRCGCPFAHHPSPPTRPASPSLSVPTSFAARRSPTPEANSSAFSAGTLPYPIFLPFGTCNYCGCPVGSMICCFGEYVCWETNTISYHPDHFSPRLSPSPPAVPTLESFFPSLPKPDPDFVRRPSSAAFPSLPAAYLPPHIPELLLRAGVERNPGPACRRKAKTPVVDPPPVRSPDPRAPPLDARGANASGSGSGSPNSPRKMRPLDSREALVTLSGGRSRSRDPLAFANPEGRHCSVVVTLSLCALVALEDGAQPALWVRTPCCAGPWR